MIFKAISGVSHANTLENNVCACFKHGFGLIIRLYDRGISKATKEIQTATANERAKTLAEKI